MDAILKQEEPLSPGTNVMVIDSTRESKWDPLFEGPFIIHRQSTGGVYELTDLNGKILDRRIPIHQIKVCNDIQHQTIIDDRSFGK